MIQQVLGCNSSSTIFEGVVDDSEDFLGCAPWSTIIQGVVNDCGSLIMQLNIRNINDWQLWRFYVKTGHPKYAKAAQRLQ